MKKALAAVTALLVLACAACAWVWMERRKLAYDFQAKLAKLEAEKNGLIARAADLEQNNGALREQLSAKGIVPIAPPPPRPRTDQSGQLESVRQLAQLQARLATAAASIEEFQNKLQEQENSVEKLTAENKRLAASEAGLREDLDSSRRVTQAMDTELKTKTERVMQLETSLRRAREEQAATAQKEKDTQAVTAASELIDINRRRENTVQNLQRRFRDLTDQLRALVVRLDTQRDNPAAAAPDISRIQTAVQSAEDDLRQLANLNTQAQRVSQKLGQK